MTILDRIIEARGHLGAAQVQRAPSDDRIIAGHIDAAERILAAVLADLRRPTLPGIRGEDILPGRVIPLARLRDLQGDDTPPEAA